MLFVTSSLFSLLTITLHTQLNNSIFAVRTVSDGAFAALLVDLCVHSEYRKKGIGYQMLLRLESASKKSGAGTLGAFAHPKEFVSRILTHILENLSQSMLGVDTIPGYLEYVHSALFAHRPIRVLTLQRAAVRIQNITVPMPCALHTLNHLTRLDQPF